MPYGLRIVGSSGAVQIDQFYRNLMLRTVATATTSSPDKDDYQTFTEYPKNGYSYMDAAPPSSPETPLVFFSADAYTGLSDSGFLVTNKARGSTSKLAVFDTPLPLPSPLNKWGLVVRTAAGVVTYYSGYRYLRVHQVLTGSDYVANPINLSLPTNRKWGFCCFKWAGRTRMDDDRAYDDIGSNLRFYRIRREIMGLRLSGGVLTSIDMSYMDDDDYAFPDMAYDHQDSVDRSYAVIIADMTHVPEW
ncbi:hypothetical protein BV98_000591 [Sphingobium herbicidovorans NBRC 16415]|uniref:Uncharacterized protein n=1 Tax=Sphingobium herbicidovorans (strain ATCC 700291 / DSM 11019 / CCUG 56400 / KCTC 2939 / LMG 18315 / NBRC 16415 / MH) TaxID=1219045 RepID=A0A086PEB5_SPHHM|nr:hypothetical protein [Sphingobium herbicidovorans]KFG91733.1 hypothetical protein BV98_000591 [Sphingobium herbicidovorans NBRC 16415]